MGAGSFPGVKRPWPGVDQSPFPAFWAPIKLSVFCRYRNLVSAARICKIRCGGFPLQPVHACHFWLKSGKDIRYREYLHVLVGEIMSYIHVINSQHSDQQNAQYCSQMFYITISLWTQPHVSIPKGSSSGNQIKATPHKTNHLCIE